MVIFILAKMNNILQVN